MVTFTANSQKNSLSVDTQIYLGQNQIRRNVGRATSFYPGGSINNQIVVVDTTKEITSSDRFNALVLLTDQPISVTLYRPDFITGVFLAVNKIMVIDDNQYNRMVLTNTSSLPATVQVFYSTIRD